MKKDSEYALADWAANGLERVEHCPICDSAQRIQLHDDLTDRVFRCAPGRWDLYQCEDCRSAYLDPRPTKDTIHLAYQTYYTHEKRNRQKTESLRPWRKFVRALANGYRNRQYGTRLKPESPMGTWLIPLFPRLRRTLDRELRYLPPLRQGAKLLDVGFGSGAFLLFAQKGGWEVYGADPDPVAVANARQAGLNARQGGIEAYSDFTAHFDVITMNHVIEHVHDPVAVIEQAYRLLKPGGSLHIDTPNIDAYGHRAFKAHWRGLEVPRHLVLFNWASLKRVNQEAGFKEIRNIYSFHTYASLARASRSIEKGIDPYASRKTKVRDVLMGWFYSCIPLFSNKKTEFITMIAIK